MSDDNSTALDALQWDLQTLIRDCKDTNLKELGSFLDEYNRQNSKAVKEKRNGEYILKSVEFPGMDSRRDQVHDAASGTLTWLLSYRGISWNHDDDSNIYSTHDGDSYISSNHDDDSYSSLDTVDSDGVLRRNWISSLLKKLRNRPIFYDDSEISLQKWLATEHGIDHHTRGKPGYDDKPWDYDDSKISLRDWLATGNGIYHITGKPGSGKSTCMKFIAESSESCEHLQGWASQQQKQLITASFFVWKAADASPLQNQVEGMIRTILHQILAEKPELIPRVFPKHWHPERFHSNSAITGTKLQRREIQEASELVFGSSDIVGPYRIFLLIDGLDEFKDDRETHYQVAKRIKDWCGRNPDNVKACISSREDTPFMNTFVAEQRLRLHLFTYRDIWKLTWHRLMEHSHFASTQFTDEQRRNLIGTIADHAEGVFLWVILTIVELTHSLDATQNFETLLRVVRRGKKDLNKFFKEVLSRIPDMYREEARALFQIVRFTTRGTSRDEFLCLFHVYTAATHATAAQYLIRPTCDTITHEDATEELELFKQRLPTVTRGLLELKELGPGFTSALAGPHALYRPTFIHRSVFEFFEENPKNLWSEDLADQDPDALGLIFQSSAKIVDTLPWSQPQLDESGYGTYHSADHWRGAILGLLQLYDERDDEKGVADPYFVSLKALDMALLRKQGILPEGVQLEKSQWIDMHLIQDSVYDLVSVFLTACKYGVDIYPVCGEFVSWAAKGGYPDWVRHPSWKARVAYDVLFRDVEDNDPSRAHPDFIGPNEVLEPNILPRSMHFSPPLRGSLWLNYLVCAIDQCASFQLGVNSEDFDIHRKLFSMVLVLWRLLENGAEPYVVFHWWSECTDTRQNDYRNLKPGPRLIPLEISTPSTAANPPEDTIYTWADRNTDEAKGMRLGAHFGLGITMGTASTRQSIQGPQWPGLRDTRLIRFFILNFGTAKGTVTLGDVLKAMCSIHDFIPYGLEERQEFVEHRDKMFQSMDNALGQGTVQDEYTESYERPSDGRPQQTLLFTFGRIWRKHKTLVLPVLGKCFPPGTTEKKLVSLTSSRCRSPDWVFS